MSNKYGVGPMKRALLFSTLFVSFIVPVASLFPQAAQRNMNVQQPLLRINRIDPDVGLPGKPVTVYYSFGGDIREVMSLGRLSFSGAEAKFRVEGPGILTAYVPFGLKPNMPIAVVLSVGGLSSPQFTAFSLAGIRLTAIVPEKVSYRIAGVRPDTVAPGDTVEIITIPELRIGALIFLTINDRSAETRIEPGKLTARIPMDNETDSRAKIVLTVDKDRVQPYFGLYVVPRPLRVLSISPNPATLGDTLHILVQPPFLMRPAGEWAVWFDTLRGIVLRVDREKFEVIALIPKGTASRTPIVTLVAGIQRGEPFSRLEITWEAPLVIKILGYLVVLAAILAAAWGIRWVVRRLRSVQPGAEAMPFSAGAVAYQMPSVSAELVKACVDGECVLYAGAGLSAQAGFPTWLPLIQGMVEVARSNRLIDDKGAEGLLLSLARGDVNAVADDVVHTLRSRPDLLANHLRDVFIKPNLSLPKAHRLVAELPFSAVLSSNFDRLSENAFQSRNPVVYTPENAEKMQEDLLGHRFFLLKLYGSLDKPETVRLSPYEYSQMASRNKPFAGFLETLFLTRTLLFVGSSLDGIEDYLKGFLFGEYARRQHFALVAFLNAGWESKANQLERRYNIKVLPYTPSQSYPETVEFLQDLHDACLRGGGAANQVTAGPGLRVNPAGRVTLENIGPFQNLELTLDPRLNILLGDNGVGKSTILKAIAASLCGESSSHMAGRLVKIPPGYPGRGLEPAKVTLEFGERLYVTRIIPGPDGTEVVTRPIRALEGEGMLAIGFPPLRTVSWSRARELKSEGRAKPQADDLLPLISGEPDPRVDTMKTWIVNLDYLIKNETLAGQSEGPNRRLLTKFFEIFDRLTPGVMIRFRGVNPETKEVTVSTADGDVPIEAVSQGTMSLLSWIGVLMQRLYEIHGDQKDPTQMYALVLIDEIDAHMHPEWQQMLVHELLEIFPNVQFIATTHSPLIVGGLPPEQITRLRRNSEGKVEKVPIEAEATMGRADQLLTSDLFDLGTTVDRHTQQRIEEYQKLLGKSKRTPEEEQQFRSLEAVLQFRIPASAETLPERRAQEFVSAILRTQGEGKFPDSEKALEQKAEALLKAVSAREGGKA